MCEINIITKTTNAKGHGGSRKVAFGKIVITLGATKSTRYTCISTGPSTSW